MANRPLHELNELMRIVKENKEQVLKPNVMDELNDAQKFVHVFKIKEGKNKIPCALMYEAYCKWCDKPVAKVTFLTQFSQIYPSYASQRNGKRHYLVNNKPMQLINKVVEFKANKNENKQT